MSSRTPVWKQIFDSAEKAAAPMLADATASAGFAEFMRVGLKISRDMNKQAEVISRQWLHAWNLPAAGDVAYLKTQIGSLEAEVRSLRRTIEAQPELPAAKTATTAKVKNPRTTANKPRTAAKKTATKKPAAKRTTKQPAKKQPAKKLQAVAS